MSYKAPVANMTGKKQPKSESDKTEKKPERTEPWNTRLGESGWRILPYIAMGWGPLTTSILRPGAKPLPKKKDDDDPEYAAIDILQCAKGALIRSFNFVQQLNSRTRVQDVLTWHELEYIDQLPETQEEGRKVWQEAEHQFQAEIAPFRLSPNNKQALKEARENLGGYAADMKDDYIGVNNFSIQRLMRWLKAVNERMGTHYVLGRVSEGHTTKGIPTDPGTSIDTEINGHGVIWVSHNGEQGAAAHWETIGPYKHLSPAYQTAQRRSLWELGLWQKAKGLVQKGVYVVLEDYVADTGETVYQGHFVKRHHESKDEPSFRWVEFGDGSASKTIKLPRRILKRIQMSAPDPAIPPSSLQASAALPSSELPIEISSEEDESEVVPKTTSSAPPSHHSQPPPLGKDAVKSQPGKLPKDEAPKPPTGPPSDSGSDENKPDAAGAPNKIASCVKTDNSEPKLVPFRVFRTILPISRTAHPLTPEEKEHFRLVLPLGSFVLDEMGRDVLGRFAVKDLINVADLLKKTKPKAYEAHSEKEKGQLRNHWSTHEIYPRSLQRLEAPWGLPSHLPTDPESRFYLPLAHFVTPEEPTDDLTMFDFPMEENEVVLVVSNADGTSFDNSEKPALVRTYEGDSAMVPGGHLRFIRRPFNLPIQNSGSTRSLFWQNMMNTVYKGPVEDVPQIGTGETVSLVNATAGATPTPHVTLTTAGTQTTPEPEPVTQTAAPAPGYHTVTTQTDSSLPPTPTRAIRSRPTTPEKRKASHPPECEPSPKRTPLPGRDSSPLTDLEKTPEAPSYTKNEKGTKEPPAEKKSGDESSDIDEAQSVPQTIKDKGKNDQGRVQYLVSFGGKGKTGDKWVLAQDASTKHDPLKTLIKDFNADARKGGNNTKKANDPKPKIAKKGEAKPKTRTRGAQPKGDDEKPKPRAGGKRKREDSDSEAEAKPAPKKGKKIATSKAKAGTKRGRKGSNPDSEPEPAPKKARKGPAPKGKKR